MEIFRYNDPSKGTMECEIVEGMCFPKAIHETYLQNTSMEDHVKCVKALELKVDDIVVCAYPKCGTHWVWELLNVLIEGKVHKQAKETRMLEMIAVDKLAELPSPRILNTHYPPHLLPVQIKEKKIKIVYIYRNPKDVVVSGYHHISKLMTHFDANVGALEDFKMAFLKENLPYNYFKYIKEFDLFLKNNPDIPSLTLTFEDLYHEPQKQCRRLAEFVGKDISDEEIQEIVKTCSFDNMKEADANFKQDFFGKTSKDGISSVFRKGKTGDWKNHFTVAENELYNEVIKRELQGYDIPFKFV